MILCLFTFIVILGAIPVSQIIITPKSIQCIYSKLGATWSVGWQRRVGGGGRENDRTSTRASTNNQSGSTLVLICKFFVRFLFMHKIVKSIQFMYWVVVRATGSLIMG